MTDRSHPDGKTPHGCSADRTAPGTGKCGTVNPDAPGIEEREAPVGVGAPPERDGGYIVYLRSNTLGGGSGAAGKALLMDFLFALTEIAPQPNAIILVGTAAHLALPGSGALESLSLMHEQGVKILVEERSARDAGIEGSIAVGTPATMHAVLCTLINASRIVCP